MSSGLLIAARTAHFASTMLLAGTVVFVVLVAGPVAHGARADPRVEGWRRQSARVVWVCLALALFSGAAWLFLLAGEIGGRPLGEVFAGDIVWRVLTRTRFGIGWTARLAMAAMLAAVLTMLARRGEVAQRRSQAMPAALAVMLLGSLAWSGHASGTPELAGDAHRAADAAHLVAAGVWLGGLVPLALLLAAARRAADPAVTSFVRAATARFSTLGLIAVGTILATGLVNAGVLAGGVPAWVETAYGRLLLVKVGLFAAMVGIAAFNRLRLMPRLLSAPFGGDSARLLQRNCLIEAAMGLLILVIVGVLGTLAPGAHSLPAAYPHVTH